MKSSGKKMNQREFEALYHGMQAGDAESIKEIVKNGAGMLRALTQCMVSDLVCQDQRDALSLMLELAGLLEADKLKIVHGEEIK